MIKKIGVLTGGGDSSAINAAIRAIKMKSIHYGFDLFGIKNGWEGLIEGKGFDLIKKGVSGTLPQGGTYLGTSRTNPFKIENGVEKVRENIEKLELDSIITIGGDDTNGVTNKLSQFGIKGVGIPQTIDNDIAYSDYSIGFDSALAVVTDAIDRLHTTASSHHRVMIVEVMGRDAGWLALHGGLAGGADVILIPEVPFDYDEIIEVIRTREQRGKDFSIIAIAEGAKPKNLDKQVTASGRVDNFGHVQLGGIGEVVSEEIEKRSGHECRVTVLGHIQRGGRPTAFDRILATRLGAKAVDMIKEEDFGKMACFKDNKIIAVPLKKAIEERKPMDMELYQLSKLFH